MQCKTVVFLFLSLFLAACGGAELSEPPVAEEGVVASELNDTTATAVATPTMLSPTNTPEVEPATVQTLPTATGEPEPPTPTPPPLPADETPIIQVVSGQLPEGAFFLGDANAPLTIIDYSDFL